MLYVLVAILFASQPFEAPDTPQVRFVTIAPSGPGAVNEIPFDQASNRYALVVEGPAGAWATEARLGQTDRFSLLQSSEVLALPPGRYGVRRLHGAGEDAAPDPADILIQFDVRAGAAYEVRCTAGGPPACWSETLTGLTRFL